MHGLTNAELKQLSEWTNTRLIDTFEGYSDRAYLIALQNTSGIANKSDADIDVANLLTTYEALRKELEQRLRENKGLVVTLEGYSNAITHNSAYRSRALGIPDDNKTGIQMDQIKADYNAMHSQISAVLET